MIHQLIIAGMPEVNEQFWNRFRDVIRQEIHQEIRQEVGNKLTTIRSDITDIKSAQIGHSNFLRSIQATLTGVKHTVRSQTKEVNRIGILLEDLEYRFEAGSGRA